jgi:hypothetical protein
VLLDRGMHRDGYRRILIPVDFAPASLEAARQAIRNFPDAHVTLLHAYQVPDHRTLEQSLLLRRTARERAVRTMSEIITTLQGNRLRVSYAVNYGPADVVVRSYSGRFAPDLIVLSEKMESGFIPRRQTSMERCIAYGTRADFLLVFSR